MPQLADRVAIVTGGAQGIGASIARAFAEEGARVVLTDIQDALGAKVARAIGSGAVYRRLDVREDADWQRVVDETLDAHARLDIVVNNAGITGFGPGDTSESGPPVHDPEPHDPEHTSLDAWHAVMRTNLDGVFLGCRHAIRGMRASHSTHKNSGSIINIGSRSGVVGIPRASAYAASKAGVRNHTKSVALYCAEEGLPIRCNVIQPAAVLTPMWDPILGEGSDREKNIAAVVADTPLKRFATPDEVAALAVYLASDRAAYCTGGEFNLDGGLLAGTAATPAGPSSSSE